MAAINGDLIIVKFDSNTIEGRISDSMSIEANMIETTTKDSNKWASFIAGDKTWTIEVELNYDNAHTTGIIDVLDDLIDGTSATCYFGGTTTGEAYWSGSGLISNVSIEGPHNDRVTGSFTIQGSGALTKATA